MATKKITKEHAQIAYQLAREVYQSSLEESDAVNILVEQHGMNPSSAEMYIATLKHLLEGRKYMRTINAYATEFYIGGIRQDFDESYFKNALCALELHFTYLEELGKGTRHTLRKIHEKFSILLREKPQNQNTVNSKFYEEVYTSEQMSKSVRNLEIGKYPSKPKTTVIAVTHFVRNPHVAAEVLRRAKGMCEGCKKRAPFLRARNNSPYLEVHHKIRLADGGDDTVENAIGLCPNCHREAHFGNIDTNF